MRWTHIDARIDYDFGKDTSIEVIHTADGGAMKNADMSKMHRAHSAYFWLGEYERPPPAAPRPTWPAVFPRPAAVIGGSASGVITPGVAQ